MFHKVWNAINGIMTSPYMEPLKTPLRWAAWPAKVAGRMLDDLKEFMIDLKNGNVFEEMRGIYFPRGKASKAMNFFTFLGGGVGGITAMVLMAKGGIIPILSLVVAPVALGAGIVGGALGVPVIAAAALAILGGAAVLVGGGIPGIAVGFAKALDHHRHRPAPKASAPKPAAQDSEKLASSFWWHNDNKAVMNGYVLHGERDDIGTAWAAQAEADNYSKARVYFDALPGKEAGKVMKLIAEGNEAQAHLRIFDEEGNRTANVPYVRLAFNDASRKPELQVLFHNATVGKLSYMTLKEYKDIMRDSDKVLFPRQRIAEQEAEQDPWKALEEAEAARQAAAPAPGMKV